jgi:hypothetical protein
MYSPLLVFLLIVIIVYSALGIWRYIRQEFQGSGRKDPPKRGDR